jgi:alkylation response protein AidB-like acyl-CoA dehydrogenase
MPVIDLMPDEEQETLIGWVRDFLDRELPRGGLLRSDVHDPAIAALLPRMGELGWFGLGDPGSTPRYADEVLLFRELGRHLVPGPLIATTIAAEVAEASGDQALAASFRSGQALAGLSERGADGRLMVLNAALVGYLLVIDATVGEIALVKPSDLPDHDFVASIDPFHEIAFIDDEPGPPPLAVAGDATASVLAYARLLAAAYLTGLAEGARDDSAAYAKERVQFGKPIAVFQAVKHRCADNALRAEAAWAQTVVAALRLGQVPVADAELDVAAAKVVAGDSAIRNARDNIQNHGGMGYTAENLAHLYLKRAHTLAAVLGDARSFTGCLLDRGATW